MYVKMTYCLRRSFTVRLYNVKPFRLYRFANCMSQNYRDF